MIGRRVRIVREEGDLRGILQNLKPEGATITPTGGLAHEEGNVFIPMARIIEIRDEGEVYR